MKIRLSGIVIDINDIKELQKNKSLYNYRTKKAHKVKYLVVFKDDNCLIITRHEYKLLEKLLVGKNDNTNNGI